MRAPPPLPTASETPSLFERGHLWLQEFVAGGHLRFRMEPTGVLAFGDRTRVFDHDAIPLRYRSAVRHVRGRFDRDALEAAVDDVGEITFFGVATYRTTIEYDWDRTPPFLGVDVHSASADRFRPPDAVDGIYDRLGLESVNAIEKEVRAVDFDPDAYEIPDSAWVDGPAAGVLVRNKTGDRAVISRLDPAVARGERPLDSTTAGGEADRSPDALARSFAADRRLERIASTIEARGESATVDTLIERVREAAGRETGATGAESPIDSREFGSIVGERVQRFLAERR